MNILFVEDEERLGRTIKLALEAMGHQVTWVKLLSNARLTLGQDVFQLVVLDRNLPDGEGLSLCSDIQKISPAPHVLILSAKSEIHFRVEGLDAGADDYLAKPFSLEELQARVRSLNRRVGHLWERRPDQLRILSPKGWLDLTQQEYKFLDYLIAHEGQVISKERLLREVWGFSLLPKTRTIDFFITQLRKRLEDDPENPKHLVTIRGAGIKFHTK